MESQQLENKVTWLDEQRRRDVDRLEALGERLGDLTDSIESHEKRMESLSDEMSRLSSLAARISQFDEAVHKHRQEVSRQLKEAEDRRESRAKSLEELRQSDQAALTKRMDELRKRVDALGDLEGEIDAQLDDRISRHLDEMKSEMADLQARMEDLSRSQQSVQEVRQTDSKRVADLVTDHGALRTRMESLQGDLDVVEDRVRRAETEVSELKSAERERKESLAAWTENQSRKLVDFEHQWDAWNERFTEFERMATELDERMIQYEETYRTTRQLQKELEQVVERLERRINEITEMQRLAEDRMKQEWAAFQGDDQKRWNTYKLTTDEQWREHDRRHSRMDGELGSLRDEMEESKQRIARMLGGFDEGMKMFLSMARDWLEESEK